MSQFKSVWAAALQIRCHQSGNELRLQLPWLTGNVLLTLLLPPLAIYMGFRFYEVGPLLSFSLLGMLPIMLIIWLRRFNQVTEVRLTPTTYHLFQRPFLRRRDLRSGPLAELRILDVTQPPGGTRAPWVLPLQAGRSIYHLGEGLSTARLQMLGAQLQSARESLLAAAGAEAP